MIHSHNLKYWAHSCFTGKETWKNVASLPCVLQRLHQLWENGTSECDCGWKTDGDIIQIDKLWINDLPRIFLPVPSIVNRGDWLWSPANIKGANKDAKIYVGRSATLHNLLFSAHTICMNYYIILVSSSFRSKQLLCFVQGQGQKTEQ